MHLSPPDDPLALGDRLRAIHFIPPASLSRKILASVGRVAPPREPGIPSIGWTFSLLGGAVIAGGLVYLLWDLLLNTMR